MIEILVYLGLSAMVLVFFGSMVVNMTRQQTRIAEQQIAQENARNALSAITYAARNAYQIDVSAQHVDFWAEPEIPNNNPKVTRVQHMVDSLLIGSAENAPPAPEDMAVLTTPDARMTDAQFQSVSSALVVTLTVEVGNQSQNIHSTIAYRQGR